MSKKDLPPVPPAGRTDKGPGPAADKEHGSDLQSDAAESRHFAIVSFAVHVDGSADAV